MFNPPNAVYLGGEPYNDRAALVFVGEDWPTDSNGRPIPSEEKDPEAADHLWRVEPDGTDFVLWNEQTGNRAWTVLGDGSQTTIHHNVRITGELTDVHLADDHTRISGFDNNGIHSIRYTANDSDEIAHIERHGVNDYDLHVLQDGSAERVFTTADDGTFDADTLDGYDETHFAARGDDETIDGAWNFTTRPTFAGADLLAADDDYQPDVTEGGAAVASSVDTFDFGADLGVTDNSDGSATIDFIGGGVPDRIYVDGAEVIADAAYLEFLDDFDVSEGGDGEAEVSLTLPDGVASVSADETITGAWTFDETIDADISGSAATADNAALLDGRPETAFAATGDDETITGTWTFDETITGTITTAESAAMADDAGTLDGYDEAHFAAHADDETVTGGWTFETGPTIDAGTGTVLDISGGDIGGIDDLRFVAGDNPDLVVDGTTALGLSAAGDVDVPTGTLAEQGSRVATRSWAEGTGNGINADTLDGNEASAFTQAAANETISGTWTFESGIGVDTGEQLTLGDSGQFLLRYSASAGRFALADATGTESTVLEVDDGATPNFPNGVESEGAAVLTEASGINTSIEVEDSDSDVVNEATALDFGTNLDVSSGDTGEAVVDVNDNVPRTDQTEVVDSAWQFDGGLIVNGNLNATADNSEEWGGFDIYVQSSPPTTAADYIRFETE